MEILGFIPARGGSKGIPNKNIVELCGKKLIEYTYEAAEKSKYLTRIILSTDSDKIANTAIERPKIEVKMREKCLATDTTKTADVIEDLLDRLYNKEKYIPDYIVILQPTSPLRSNQDIDNCMEMLLKDSTIDSVVSVCQAPHNCIPEKIMMLEDGLLKAYLPGGERYTTRQELPQYYARNGAAVYAFKTSVFRKTHNYYGTKCLPYIMEEERSIDIDNQYDLELARLLIKRKNCAM